MPRLRALIDEMVDIQRRMGEVAYAAREDAGRKSDLVAIRRRFAQQVVAVGDAIDGDPLLAADPMLAAEFRRRLAEMRSGIAIHQAKWPAVLLDNEDEEFRTSADAIIRTNRAFAAWATSVLRK